MADVLIKEWDVGAMRRPSANAPSASRTPGANFPWDALNFDPTADEYIYMFGTMPESDLYTAAQPVKLEISWISDAASVGVTRWYPALLGREAGEAWDVALVNFPAVNSARTAANALHIVSTTHANPPLSPGDDFIVKVLRRATHVDDTYPVDCDVVRVRMYTA